MEWKWTVEAIIALFALFISIISLFKSWQAKDMANKLTNEANMLTKGQVEIQIREMISAARYRYSEMGCKFLDKETKEETAKSFINSATEDYLNAYDEACAKYLDGKVDKKRFKKLYFNEIKNLVEHEQTRDKYIGPQTRFQDTVDVYQEWCKGN